MADDIRLVIGVEKKGVLSAITATETLEKKVKKLSDTYARGGITTSEYNKGIAQLAKATKKSKDELLAYGTAIRANAKAVDAAAIAEKQRLKVLREEKVALDQKNKAEAANSAELQRFRISTDQVYAAEQKLLRLKKMLRAEVEAGNMTMRQAAAVQMQYKKSLTTMGGGLTQTKNKMSSMGVVTQQAGYQLGDFIVQVQAGQNPLIAFSQQATQMVGFLPLMASRLGLTTTAAIGLSAALGIGIPIAASIAMVLFSVSKSAKDAADSAERFEDKLKSARDEILSTADAIRVLQGGFSGMSQLTLSDEIDNANNKVKLARRAVEELIQEVIVSNEAMTDGLSEAEIRAVALDLALDPNNAIAIAMAARDAAEAELERLTTAERQLSIEQQLAAVKAKIQRDTQENNKAAREELVVAQRDNELKAIGLKYGEDSLEYLNEQHRVEKLLLEQRIKEEYLTSSVADNLRQALVAGQLFELVDFSNLDRAASAADRLRIAMTKVGGGKKEVIFDPRDPRYDPIAAAVASMEHGTYDPDKDKQTGDSDGASAKDPLQTLKEQIALQQALLGKTEAQQQIINALGVDYQSKYKPSVIDALETQITLTGILSDAETKRKEALEEAKQQQEQLADYIANSMGDALMSIVDGTMTVKDAFKSMASDIIKELYRVLVVERMVQSIKGFLSPSSPVVPSANGNVLSNGSIQAYANGGVVGGPTFFPMAGGKTGLMGEAGPEAIMPLKRGANGKLGVQMEGGGGDTINVVQNFNFQANGDDTVKKLIAQAAPKIAQMTKSSLLDDRRRGGSTKAAFG